MTHRRILPRCQLRTATAGFAFHFGSRRHPAMRTEAARTWNRPFQPNWSCRKPGRVPPRMAPTEPHPLIKPQAVEAPFFVPKSIAAVPLTNESGANERKPIHDKQPANTHIFAG